MKRKLSSVILLIVFCFSMGLSAWAADKGKRTISIEITYGEKGRTERNFNVLADPSLKTHEGNKATITLENLDNGLGFKMEVTPTIGADNPELIILVIRAWELREVERDGKTVKDFVEVLNQTSRVARGATMINEQRAGIDRDIQFTITPTYKD